MKNPNSPALFAVILLFIIVVLALETLVLMLIWNNVIIKKFPDWNIQKLSFWDALAFAVFFGLLTSVGGIVKFGSSNGYGYK